MRDTLAPLPDVEPFLVGGEWIVPDSGELIEVIDPATQERITSVPQAETHHVDLAVGAALAAHEDGRWWGSSPHDRARTMHRIADLIEDRLDELAILETRDNGKPIERSRADTATAARVFRYYAGAPSRLTGTVIPVDGGDHYVATSYEPAGVAALILPWNFPIMEAAFKLGPALGAGCAVVVKPAEQTPLTMLRLAAICEEGGVPSGVVNVLTGDGRTGAALTAHPDVSVISFTGSTEVGGKVLTASVDGFKRTTLELGGKSPNIIFADADLDAAVLTAMRASFGHSGQMCTAGSRILVQRSVLQEVTERLSDAAKRVPVGDGLAGGVTVGPLVSAEQRDIVLDYIERGRAEGAEVIVGGGAPNLPGFYVEPTIFSGVTNDMVIAREEIFGPVVGIIPFDSDEEAVRIANDTPYGLAAGVWTRDLTRAHRMARQLRAGTVWVNTYNFFDPALPFGGVRDSGLGRDLGEEALIGFCETKSVVIAL